MVKNYNKPSSSYVFMVKYMHGCNRALKHAWLQCWTPWLVYSERLDGGLCVACAMFSSDMTKIIKACMSPFTCWTKQPLSSMIIRDVVPYGFCSESGTLHILAMFKIMAEII